MNLEKKRTGTTIKKIRRFWRDIEIWLSKIHLVDKCLLALMLVLMIQSTYILLTNGGNSTEVHHIDIIVRTASASIFGYFLSANFVQRSIKSKLGAGIEEKEDTREELPPIEDEKNAEIARIQIMTATTIAMFCLLSLILVRDFAAHSMTANPATVAVASQFRDFISGCVGFLIGCPTTKAENKQTKPEDK